jgi:large subunit ribosomal protein L31e
MSETERIYTVPLKEAWNAQRYRRSERAMMVLKAFALRHMKATSITVDTSVNEAIWTRGIKSPPHRIRVKMTKNDEGAVTITLAEAEAHAEAKKESKIDAKPKQEPIEEAKPEEKTEENTEPAEEAKKKE